MEFVVLKENEFKKFAYKHEQASFFQTINWGKLKSENGWEMELVGVKDNKKIIAVSNKDQSAFEHYMIDLNEYTSLSFVAIISIPFSVNVPLSISW